jgi:flagellar motor switch/type III secretory pathway protein FliN
MDAQGAMGAQTGQGDSSPMASMPVELTLHVGTVSLPLAKLMEMSEGQTFTDEVTSFFPRVRLHSADRQIAEGELVRVDGRVGFRVTKIFG